MITSGATCKLLLRPVARGVKTSFPLSKAVSAILCFSQWHKLSNSDITDTTAATLTSWGAAIVVWSHHCCCVSVQGLHPLEAAFEGQLHHNATQRLSRIEGSSKCSPQMLLLFPLFGGCTATILRGLTYPNILCASKKEEGLTSLGTVRHFHRPGQQKSWCNGKTSGDATRKCYKVLVRPI